ncbi:MAG: formimidoylglutamase [Flammeovirgaceae bacterium]
MTNQFYKPTLPSRWEGRLDGTAFDVLRWHQIIQLVNIQERSVPVLQKGQRGIAFVGFCCDEGVKRNKGREGAEEGAIMMRKACASFPVHISETVRMIDVGDIVCQEKKLEKAQESLGDIVCNLIENHYFVIILGGGHEVAYAHYLGVKKFLEKQVNKSWGFFNIDAHFDLRQVEESVGASSGTPFWQIAQDRQALSLPFEYFCLGIQQCSNTKRLFDTAQKLGVKYIQADDLFEDTQRTNNLIDNFASHNQYLSLTIDMDAFASAYAPGVSATAFNGIIPDFRFKSLLRQILSFPHLISMDIAELNPRFDQDNRTAKLAASFIYEAVSCVYLR